MQFSYWANALKPPLVFLVSTFFLVGLGWLFWKGLGAKLGGYLAKGLLIGACASFILFWLEFAPALAR